MKQEALWVKQTLEPLWDTSKPCHNPHKGWYIHYFDNSLRKYGDRLDPEDDLKDFPCLSHIYLRLAWSYLEPEEKQYNWSLLDEQIEKWTKRGYTISFRITCKETAEDQPFATPKWVMEKGAKGLFHKSPGGAEIWEPDYGDPIFLDALDRFHREFSLRYDGQPWVEYIDIGSFGDWGEFHTAASGDRDWPLEAILAHLDIHVRWYKRSKLMISDDIIGSRKAVDGSRDVLLAYLLDKEITLRDDGVSVLWFVERFGRSTLRSPELFEHFWRRMPINLELQHYHVTVEEGTWQKGEPFVAAAEESHATYLGFHGYPREWLRDNQELAISLGNRSGYWYFPKMIETLSTIVRGGSTEIRLVWENRGVAPAYHRYGVELLLEGEAESFLVEPSCSDNRKWMPGCTFGETYRMYVPSSLPAGRYKIKVRMRSENRRVELGLSDKVRDQAGFYAIGGIELV